jgi:NADH:ubiquinone oxidoreductase subunit 5 (subunit L)/multisubunit Na+/H+ antiporter MnhA subunit
VRAALVWFAFALLALLLLSVLLAALAPGYVWHPLDTTHHHGAGYDFWSGVAGSFLTSLPGWIAALVVYLHARNCHADGCWRIAWHPHGLHGHPVCKVHHPHGKDRPHTIGGTAHDELAV